MTKLRLVLACWDYDRTRPLMDGKVKPDGIDLVHIPLWVQGTFHRMLRNREFHVAETSFSAYVSSLFAEEKPFHSNIRLPLEAV